MWQLALPWSTQRHEIKRAVTCWLRSWRESGGLELGIRQLPSEVVVITDRKMLPCSSRRASGEGQLALFNVFLSTRRGCKLARSSNSGQNGGGWVFSSASAIRGRKDQLLSPSADASDVEEPSGLCCPELEAGVWGPNALHSWSFLNAVQLSVAILGTF